MSSTWRSVILALAVSLAVAAIALLVVFRCLLPEIDPFTDTREPQYVIGDWQGQVAVFEGRQSYPMQILDVYTKTLPSNEQQQVMDGIPVIDGRELWKVLEDYTG